MTISTILYWILFFCVFNTIYTVFLVMFFFRFIRWYRSYATQLEEFVRAFAIYLRDNTPDLTKEEQKEQPTSS